MENVFGINIFGKWQNKSEKEFKLWFCSCTAIDRGRRDRKIVKIKIFNSPIELVCIGKST